MKASVGLMTVAFLVSSAALPVEAARYCHGERVTIRGTDGNDTLKGGPDADVIHGLGGNDAIRRLGATARSWRAPATTSWRSRTTTTGTT